MAGPYKPFRTSDVNLNSVQAAVRDFADQLEDARQGVPAFPSAVVTRRTQLSNEAVVRYVGGTDTLFLPSAMQRGRGRGQVIVVMHEGQGTLTIAPAAATSVGSKPDTLTPAVALTTGQLAIIVSDGYNAWFALVTVTPFVLPNQGPGAGVWPSSGNGIASISVDAHGILNGPVVGATFLTALPAFGPGAGTYGPFIATATVDATGRISAFTAQTPVTTIKANTGGTLFNGAIEVDGAGEVVTSGAANIITITGKRGGSYENYAHAPTLSGLTTFMVANAVAIGALTTRTNAANTLIAVPFVVPSRGPTLDRIAVEVTTGVAATNVRLGIYSNLADNNLYPGTMLFDSGNLPSTAASVQSASPSLILTPGALMWAVTNSSSAATVLRGLPGASCSGVLGMAQGVGVVAGNVAITLASAFGAMPAPFPTLGSYLLGSSPIPMIQLRMT